MNYLLRFSVIVQMVLLVGLEQAMAQPSLAPPPGTVTDVTELPTAQPTQNLLEQNNPNPAVGYTNISFSLIESGNVTLRMFDITGKRVTNLLNEPLDAGVRNIELNTQQFPSGIYLYQLTLNNTVIDTKRLLIFDQ